MCYGHINIVMCVLQSALGYEREHGDLYKNAHSNDMHMIKH